MSNDKKILIGLILVVLGTWLALQARHGFLPPAVMLPTPEAVKPADNVIAFGRAS